MPKRSEADRRFAFGAAAALYARGVHPRVVMGPADVARLREAGRTGAHRTILAGLRRKIAPFVARVRADAAPADTFRTTVKGPDYAIIWNIADLALVGVLDECDDTIQAARKALLTVPAAFADPAQCGGNVYTMMYGCHPLAYDLLHAHLSADERAAYCGWVLAACLRPTLAAPPQLYYHNAGANTPICYTLPLLLGLLAIEGDAGVPDLTDAYRELLARLAATLHATIGEDGFPIEDIGYGTAVVAGLAQVVEPLRRAGRYDAYADCPRYTKFGDAILHFAQPWGRYLTNTGDHSDCIICRETVLAREAATTGNAALRWLLGRLVYPTTPPLAGDPTPPTWTEVALRPGYQVPATGWSLLLADDLGPAARPRPATSPTAFCDRSRGIVSFRSGWDDDATLLVFDGSRRSASCQGHQHASGGHFGLSALGEYFAIDTGRYNIEQDCHNVVLVDGRSGRSTHGEWRHTSWDGRLTEYQPGAFCDTAAADSTLQHACHWARRRVGLVKGAGAPAYVWTLEDVNKEDDWTEFWWQLHTSPENTITITGATATITGWQHGHQLDVHFVLPRPDAYPRAHTVRLEQDVATPSSHKYVTDPHARVAKLGRPADQLHGPVYVRPRLLAKVSGYNGRFLSLLLPRRQGEAPATVCVLPTVDNALAVRVSFGTVADTLICAYEHQQLEADGVSGRGDWCVVRRDRATRRVLHYELGNGTRLTVDGRALRVGAAPALGPRDGRRPASWRA